MKNKLLDTLKWWSRFVIVAGLIIGLAVPNLALAQDDTDDEDEEDVEELEGYTYTGSLLKRADIEGPVPVLSLDRESIEKSGFQQVSDLLRNLPLNNGLSEADATASFAADGAYVNLRGIGPNGTLVLVNGRRMAPYGAADWRGRSFVDLNAIPPSAIERVEVLKTGASAIYGSDALGGAINIILRKDYEGAELAGFYGNTVDGDDFGTVNLSLTVGASSAKSSLLVTANWYKRNEMRLDDKWYARYGNFGETDDSFYFSLPYGQDRGGWAFVSSASYPGLFGNAAEIGSSFLFAGDGSEEAFGEWAYANYNRHITAITQANRKGVIIIGSYDLSDNVEVYYEGNYQTNYGASQFAPAPSFNEFTVPKENPYNPTNPNNTAYYQEWLYTDNGLDPAAFPEGFDIDRMRYRPQDAGNRLFETTSDFYRVLTGFKVMLPQDWEADISYMWVESQMADSTRNLLVIDNVQSFLDNTETSATSADPNSWALNPFAMGVGEGDNDILYNEYIKTDDTRFSNSTLSMFSLLGRGTIFDLPAGSVGLAVGAEYREESLEDRPSLASQQGQLVGSGGASSDGSRQAEAIFAEVGIPVLKNLEVQAAARYEEYSDFGDTGVKPQYGVKFTPVEDLTIRAAFADNFKAPSLAQSYAGLQRAFGNVTDGIRYPITGFNYDGPAQQKEIRTGGNPDLTSEESESVSVGVIIEPRWIDGLTISADVWRIQAVDLITTRTRAQILADEEDAYNANPAAFLALSPQARLETYNVLRLPNETVTHQTTGESVTVPGQIEYINSVYFNLDSLDTDGIDLDLNYVYNTENLGQFTFNTFWVYVGKYDDGGGVNDIGGFRLPQIQGNIGVSWERGDWGASALAYFVDEYEDSTDIPGDPEPMIESWWTFDARVSYSGLWDTQLTIGVDNVMGEDPPWYRDDNAGYDPAFADPIGRFVWVAAKRSF